MNDTSATAAAVRLAALRRLDPVDRLRLALDLSDTLRRLAAARVAEGSAREEATDGRSSERATPTEA